MRTSIVLNEQLVDEAMKLSRAKTKAEVVDLALQSFVADLKRQNIKNLFGKVNWECDINDKRSA
ncbi:MAG: type II toxin-antitoxin system VapB family antitoxin [Bacteroidota bacterium]